MAEFRKADKPAIWLFFLANLLLPAALLIFATGFFPYKPFISGIDQFSKDDLDTKPQAPFDKVVFMVVDALRSDFVYSNNSGFSFVQSLIRSGNALPFTGHATSPTITMPRIKALTTGSIPSFLDVILNFAESDTTSTLANQDTWPLQLSLMEGGKINMFGDDTWIKLFPKLFSRMDGTTSFFVSDFTEVDNNVTRHVSNELKRNDWNGMIMHYLGLDHIGHKTGPNSPNMLPKQKEMDAIVNLIYESMVSEHHHASTLLVLCGDHGMNEAGNHGGSAAGETSTALLFISPKLRQITKGQVSPAPLPEDEFRYYTTVEQSDVVPTLASLLGFPIPLNNLGVFIPEFLSFWSSSQEKGWILRKNMAQIMGVVEPAFPSVQSHHPPAPDSCDDPSGDAARLHCGFHRAKSSLDDELTADSVDHAYKFLRDAQDTLSSVSSNYDMPRLQIGVFAGIAAYLLATASIVIAAYSTWLPSSSFSILFWIGIVQLLYGVMMFASSYVEEEQHFWYWISSAWLFRLYLSRYCSRRSLTVLAPMAALVLSRVIRRWNQTGQKFAGEPDIARTSLPSHNVLLWTLAIITYAFVLARCYWIVPTWLSRIAITCANIWTFATAIHFKLGFTAADAPELLDGVPFAKEAEQMLGNTSLSSRTRRVYLNVLISGFMLLAVKRTTMMKMQSVDVASCLHSIFTFALLTQTRLQNIPLILLFLLQFSALEVMNLSHTEITLTIFLLQHVSFFAFGGSNAISSIDLSNAYNGVEGYNAVAVGLLTFVSNWVGPIWWTLGGTVLLLRGSRSNHWSTFFQHNGILTMMTASNMAFVQVACLMLRSHLFIWTVFSPKYLYTMAWTLGQHLGCNLLLSSVLVWAAKAI